MGSGIEAPPPSDYAAVVPTDISPASGAQTVDNKTYPADGVNLAPTVVLETRGVQFGVADLHIRTAHGNIRSTQ